MVGNACGEEQDRDEDDDGKIELVWRSWRAASGRRRKVVTCWYLVWRLCGGREMC